MNHRHESKPPASDRNDGPKLESPRSPFAIREPAVAGLFYPSQPNELASAVDDLLCQARPSQVAPRSSNVRALICPHAGYAYSGATAAHAYGLLDPRVIRTVFLLAPAHYCPQRSASVSRANVYRTPLGDVPISKRSMELARHPPFFLETSGESEVYRPSWARQSSRSTPPPDQETAHTWEHADEVQVPFLQRVLGDFSLVPVICGSLDTRAAAEVLARFLDPESLVIASSDLSHFHPYEEAQSLDHRCLQRIRDLDADALDVEQACGAVPIAIVLRLAKKLGWRSELLDYRNSGDTGGDRSRVVGYASMAFFDSGKECLSREEQGRLLHLARRRFQEIVHTAEAPVVPPLDLPLSLQNERASFVTLTKQGALRGCIGNLIPRSSLYDSVMENVAKAAVRDSRFDPVTASELNEIRIEISVLGPTHALEFNSPEELLAQLEPHRHGVILNSQGRTATFLPQVWKQLPDKRSFLNQLAKKSGLAENAWRKPDTQISVYEVVSFEEEITPTRPEAS